LKPYWLSLAYDIANPLAKGEQGASGPASPHFPLARHKDFYDGHSWASGLFDQANSKSQESVSEATNAYYGASRTEAALMLPRAPPLTKLSATFHHSPFIINCPRASLTLLLVRY
jgi:hypothetical protein